MSPNNSPEFAVIAWLISIVFVLASWMSSLFKNSLIRAGRWPVMNGFNPFQPDVNDIFEIKQKYGDKIFVWGNIDLNHTLTRGTIEETITEVKAKIKQLAPGGGYMMATANSITDYCKVENILAMMETKDKYGIYPI